MKESERLTTAIYKHMTDKYKTATKKWEVSFQKVYDQLFAYEDTGLSPEEVKRLKYNTECVIKKLEELKNGGVCTYRNGLAGEALALIKELKAENAELRARVEKWREPFVEQDQTTGNWWVFHSRIEVFASANSDLFGTREEAEARLKELGGKRECHSMIAQIVKG